MLKTFMIEPTRIVKIYLRRYASSSHEDRKCVGKYSYHDAMKLIGKEEVYYENRRSGDRIYTVRTDEPYLSKYQSAYPDGHPKYPIECDWCGYRFQEDDEYQIFTDLVWKSTVDDAEYSMRNLPEGAMYFAWWERDNPRYAPTGPLYAVCPGRYPWNIDGRASNCTMPDDNEHRCWVRHGEPPEITVDKNGKTCAAGAGSIQAGDYHGFLQNGYFT